MNFSLLRIFKPSSWCRMRYCTFASENLPVNFVQDSKLVKVLHFFNNVDENVLKQYNVGEKYIMRLIEHRNKHGLFRSMSELVTVTGLSLDMLQKVSKKSYTNSMPKRKEGPSKLVTNPVLSPEMCKNITNVVGLDITLPYLTISHLSRNMELHSWERIPVSSENVKFDIHSCYNEAIELASSIPKADVYLMEQKHIRPKHLTHVPYIMKQTAFEAFFLTQLKPSLEIENQLKIILIKNSSLSNIFKILVGNERVTSQGIIQKLLEGEPIHFLPSLPEISISQKLKSLYLNNNLTNKEFMCNCLLLCLAFYECIVFKEEKVNTL